ncbi:hypothetical protein BDY24DRAFT_392967 [Mrakia frigida]|uniref:uncharacterized protein n=1 Tax=Mrakia frigida TaxID=29902 RepID=UPI003FCBF2A7
MERNRAKLDRFTGDLDLTEEERLAYVLMLSREEDQRRSNPGTPSVRKERSSSSSASGRSQGHQEEEEDDEQLRLALEASLLDEDPSYVPDDEQEELEDEGEFFEEDDEDDSYYYQRDRTHSNASSYTPDSPLRQPSSSSSYIPQPQPRYSRNSPFTSPILSATRRRPSSTPSPTFGSLDDKASWPAMMGTPSSSAAVGKKVQGGLEERIVRETPPKMDWSKVAAKAPVGGGGGATAAASPRREVGLSREEREEEELRLVLEMSLMDS